MFFSPAMRLASSAVGGTFCGGAGGGGGGGGGGAATTPPRSPPTTPPSTPPSTPLGSPVSIGASTSCFSILTGCTMSRILREPLRGGPLHGSSADADFSGATAGAAGGGFAGPPHAAELIAI